MAITIKGRARLERKLAALPKVAKEHIREELGKAADEIVGMMERLAPADTGALRASIGWTWGRAPAGSVIVGQVKSALGSQLTLTIYAGSKAAYYARFIEFGTVKMPAQAFFYPSWRASKKSARRKVRKAVRDSARQVAAGG